VKTLRRRISASRQASILNRDHGRCVLCAGREALTIGHLLSLEEGLELGASSELLNSDANLAAMCEACNIGLAHGPKSVNPRLYALVMLRLIEADHRRMAGGEQQQLL
jgi:hypothetical protein